MTSSHGGQPAMKQRDLQFVGTIPAGADWRWHPDLPGAVIIAHPDRPVYIIMPDGAEAPLLPEQQGDQPACRPFERRLSPA